MTYAEHKQAYFDALDWSKTNKQLIEETGCCGPTLTAMRYARGAEKRTKWSDVPWAKLDWKKNDQELAGELGLMPSVVREYRIKLRKKATHHYKPSCKISKEAAEVTDWARSTDMELSIKFECSREFIRQYRLSRRLPKCRFKNVELELLPMFRWIDDHRSELDGLPLREACAKVPFPGDLEHKKRVLRRLGVKYTIAEDNPAWLRSVNWDIPNCVLSMVWSRPIHTFQIGRYRLFKKKAKWHVGGGFTKRWQNEEFLAAVEAEFPKVSAAGIKTDTKRFDEWFRKKKEKTAQ